MSRSACALSVACLVASAGSLPALTVIPPVNLSELARDSDAVVVAQAMAAEVVGDAFYSTRTTFIVEDEVRGELTEGGAFVVETPGGRKDDAICVVPGSPTFDIGSSYFLCLSKVAGDRWVPRMASYGVLREVAGLDGLPTLRQVPGARYSLVARPDGRAVEKVGAYRRTELVDHLRSCLELGEAWDEIQVSARGVADELALAPAGCSYFSVSGGGQTYSFRWFEFDEGGSISMAADASNDAQVDALSIVPEAVRAWNDVTSGIDIRYAGTVSLSTSCASSDPFLREGRANSTIVFNDPCRVIPDLTAQGGVVANGGIRAGLGGSVLGSPHANDECRVWARIEAWYVLVNNNVWGGFGLSSLTQYSQVLTHELGHGLGFDHVADPLAMMNGSCCHSFNETDVACASFAYPPPEPRLETSSSSLDFGTITAGTQKTLNLTVRSVGNVTLKIDSIGLDTGDGAFSMAAPGAAQVSPCAQVPAFDISVTFSPAAPNVYSGAIIFSGDAPWSPIVVPLGGEASWPLIADIEADPATIDFGEVRTGATPTLPLVITNAGTAPLAIGSVAVSLGGPTFSLSGASSGTLAPGSSLSASVRFAPTTVGQKTGRVTIASSDPDEPSLAVDLRGTAVAPKVQVLPSSIDFTAVEQGATRKLGVEVRNAGTAPLAVTSIALEPGSSPDFLPAWPAASSIPVGGTLAVDVVYAPSDVGADAGAVVIATDDPSTPQSRVPLAGTGAPSPGGFQVPGDCNSDGKVDISDAICLLGFLFLGQPSSLPCEEDGPALDWNGDGTGDLSDPVALLVWNFGGGPAHVLDSTGTGQACVRIADCPDVCSP